jgi:hypothetical protein
VRIILLFYIVLLSQFVFSQGLKKQGLELTGQLRREKQADYTTRFGNTSSQNNLQLYGTSTGFDIGYKRILDANWFVKPSVGFYKFSVDKIINRIPEFSNEEVDHRPIRPWSDSILLAMSTNNYFYNNLALGIAFGKLFSTGNNWMINTNLGFTYLHSFSQHYDIGKDFRTTNNRNLGFLFDYKIGVQKEFKNLYLATNIILPVYKKWKLDAVFLENLNDKTDVWFGGYGLSLTIGKFLK